MYQRLENCPICKRSSFANQIICEDHLVTGESFAIVQCNSCKFLFTNPRPTEEELGKYYDSDAYISHADKANSLINLVYKIVRSYTLRQKVKLINSLTQHKTLYDYGCGTGDFLAIAQKNGWEIHGLEPNHSAAKLAEKKTGISLVNKSTDLSNKVQVITAWHVIEHISNLQEVMQDLSNTLATDGHLIIAVPNHKSHDAKHYGKYWGAYDVPRHLSHFDRESIEKLANKNGLSVSKTVPMRFDSYYVSILSEKNRGMPNFFRALYRGWLSNQQARRSGEYSSLIYILRK